MIPLPPSNSTRAYQPQRDGSIRPTTSEQDPEPLISLMIPLIPLMSPLLPGGVARSGSVPSVIQFAHPCFAPAYPPKAGRAVG